MISIKGVKIELRMIPKMWSWLSDTNFAAYALHTDHPPAWELTVILMLQAFWITNLIMWAPMFEHKNIEGIKFRTFFKFDENSSIPLSDQRGSLKGWVSHSLAPVFVSRFAKNRNLSHTVSVRIRWAPKFTFFVRVSMDYFHFSHNSRIGLRTLKPQIIR